MIFVIGILTVIMTLDSLLLILLVLIQLPKKEAGAGIAFGGGATDALFGAGSGNVLTKITKYAATIFFVVAIILSLVISRAHRTKTAEELAEEWKKSGRPPSESVTPPPVTPAPAIAPLTTNSVPVVPPKPATNPPPTATPITPAAPPAATNK